MTPKTDSATAQRAHFRKSDTLEYEGVTYSKGDTIEITGLGKMSFRDHTVNEKTESEWVSVFQHNHGSRSFHLDRIKTSKKPTRAASSNSQTEVLCLEHKTYGAIRKPRTDCVRCWAAYENRKVAK